MKNINGRCILVFDEGQRPHHLLDSVIIGFDFILEITASFKNLRKNSLIFNPASGGLYTFTKLRLSSTFGLYMPFTVYLPFRKKMHVRLFNYLLQKCMYFFWKYIRSAPDTFLGQLSYSFSFIPSIFITIKSVHFWHCTLSVRYVTNEMQNFEIVIYHYQKSHPWK